MAKSNNHSVKEAIVKEKTLIIENWQQNADKNTWQKFLNKPKPNLIQKVQALHLIFQGSSKDIAHIEKTIKDDENLNSALDGTPRDLVMRVV